MEDREARTTYLDASQWRAIDEEVKRRRLENHNQLFRQIADDLKPKGEAEIFLPGNLNEIQAHASD